MNIKSILYSNAILFLLFFFVFNLETKAQLQANFTIDKQGGCSPLSVKFTNTSTGTSATTTYQWAFGNGNSSTLANPGATYYDEKTYTITLTAKDGTLSATKTLDLVVYKKPAVDFSVAPAKGCVPLVTSLTANATPGDGTVAKYFWDFGDGTTDQVTTKNVAHTYTFAQKPPITLTVTNSYGCYTTVTKNNLVDAIKSVTANFKPSSLSVCNPGDEISFENTSTGSGTLTYAWDFGDGNTSAAQLPKHAYGAKGTYTVTLSVKSSDGCTATATPVTINVANFIADFDVPSTLCQSQPLVFANKLTKPYDNFEWSVDNNSYGYYNIDLYHTFYQAGEHIIKLSGTYGKCVVSATKKIIVNPSIQLNGYIADLQGACGVPLTIKFKDTTVGATQWKWDINNSTPIGNTQATTYTFANGSVELVNLTVTNKEGCSSKIGKYIYYAPPDVNIYQKNYTGYGAAECIGKTIVFAANPANELTDYKWTFGDGTTSIEKEPSHTFSKSGSYQVTLTYTTVNGCTGTATYKDYINIIDRPKFDFSVFGSTTICGNTPTQINASPAAEDWYFNWTFNDTYHPYTGSFWGNSIDLKFQTDTTYTVQMVASRGNCQDTVLKKNYLKVLPPFPHIAQHFNTCDDTRGEVRFTENSYKALQWKWDFGDGQNTSYSSFKDTIPHNYTKTGSYKVVLSTVNGPCTVKDSIEVYVLLKQKGVLSSTKTDACGSDIVDWKLSGFETNPYPYYYLYTDFYVIAAQYNDLTPNLTSNYWVTGGSNWRNQTNGELDRLEAGKTGIRFITRSEYFNCEDTTNFIPIKVHGPTAGFSIKEHSECFKDPVFFIDSSHGYNGIPITKWEWDYGDNTINSFNAGGNKTHTYREPGSFYITQTVTDADGCKSSTIDFTNHVNLSGPKADFQASAYNIPPNTLVNFYNNSLFYEYYGVRWIFPDGSQSTDEYPTFLFKDEGVHNVMMITNSRITACTDTAIKTITVRKVNSAFTHTLSYINNNSCPPVIARFTSISANAVNLAWDFGDGSIGGDQQIVSHTYNEAGIYRVVHYSYDANNAVDSTEDFIEIKGPYALLNADTLYACNTLQVKLSADVRNAQDFNWDFGDGTLVDGTDTFETHNYLTPGIYTPAVILKDQGGCNATSSLPNKIVVDSLSATFSRFPAAACNTAAVTFTPAIYSLSHTELQAGLQYRWIIKENTQTDTLFTESGSYHFNQPGVHNINLQVKSAYGCTTQLNKTVDIKAGVKASIEGPLQICKNDAASFKGSVLPASANLQWTWKFDNTASDLQNPPAHKFLTSGQKPVSLIVSNGNCADTANFILAVQEMPQLAFSLSKPVLCLGDTMTLTASGADSYQWAATSFINNTSQGATSVWPSSNKFYAVKGTNSFGCSSNDSVEIKVIQPFKLNVQTPLFACFGNTIQLTASGADKYQWLPSTGLSNAGIANPVASLPASANYTVVGYDNFNCFADTAKVAATIGQLPTINVGPDHRVIAGSRVELVTSSSGDVVKWSWLPIDFLSCTNCASPTSKPAAPIVYIVTAATAAGCTAKDTVHIELLCKSDLVYIPAGFTPNGDNLNERFAIHGSGVKSILHFVVFDRWGKTVFERKDATVADRNSSWDGNANGQPAPSGAYVYMVKLECEAGEIFTYQGTVTLVR